MAKPIDVEDWWMIVVAAMLSEGQSEHGNKSEKSRNVGQGGIVLSSSMRLSSETFEVRNLVTLAAQIKP